MLGLAPRSDAARRALPGGRPLFPTSVEARYQRDLLRRTHAASELLHEAMMRALAASPGIDERATAARQDSAATDLARLVRVVDQVRVAHAAAYPVDEDKLRGTAAQVDLFTTREQSRIIPAAPAVDVFQTRGLLDLYTSWAGENAGLITSIDAQYFDQVRDVIVEAVREGRTTREIAGLLRERYEVSRSRAKFIARDQIAKLNGQITQQRQTALGVLRYKWSTSLDERVRPTHRVLEGKIFAWAKPPSVGHPGQDYQCRCVAIPILED